MLKRNLVVLNCMTGNMHILDSCRVTEILMGSELWNWRKFIKNVIEANEAPFEPREEEEVIRVRDTRVYTKFMTR